MTASRLAAPGGGTRAGALQRGDGPASKRPGGRPNAAQQPGRRRFPGVGRQTLASAADSAIAEITRFAASLRGGAAEAARRLGVSPSTVQMALQGTYPVTPAKLLEAWARYRAAHPVEPATYLIRVVRLGRVLVAGRYFMAPGLERLNGRQVVLQPDGEHRFVVYAGSPLQVVGHAVTWAEAQALVPIPAPAPAPQGETT